MKRIPKLLVWLFVGFAVLIGAAYFWESPKTSYKRIQREIAAENWKFVYSQLSQNTRKQFQMATAMADLHLRQVTPGAVSLSAEDEFVKVVPRNPRLRSTFEVKGALVSKVTTSGRAATLTVSGISESAPRTVTMVEEAGGWKLDVNLPEKTR